MQIIWYNEIALEQTLNGEMCSYKILLYRYYLSLPNDLFILHPNGEAAGDDAAVLLVPDLNGLVQSGTRQTTVCSVQGHPAGASRGDDAVVLHQINVDIAGGDVWAVSVTVEGALDLRASRVLTAEETVQLHIVLLAVDDDTVGLNMAEHQLAHVRTMPEAAVEHARQRAALAAVVAVIFLHVPHVCLLTFLILNLIIMYRTTI